MSSKYSFYNIKKSDVLDLYDNNGIHMDIDYDIDMNIDYDIDIFSDTTENNTEISIYIHENDLIMQECCFQTGETRLLRDNEDGTLAVLYERRKEGDFIFYNNIYSL